MTRLIEVATVVRLLNSLVSAQTVCFADPDPKAPR